MAVTNERAPSCIQAYTIWSLGERTAELRAEMAGVAGEQAENAKQAEKWAKALRSRRAERELTLQELARCRQAGLLAGQVNGHIT